MVRLSVLAALVLLISGCANINIGPSYDKPLKEQVVEEGDSDSKILLLPIEGTISDVSKPGLLSQAPSLMDKVMMQLKKAEEDKSIKAVLLKINSPGGSVTSSDILYRELMAFKKRTGKKIFVQMMDVAASGGYYISLAADHIQAHPTTVTGSVGVITMTPDISELMNKVGVEMNVYKSGINKDIGSPFKQPSKEDREVFSGVVSQLAQRFYALVVEHRHLKGEQMDTIKTARIFSGEDAAKIGLVDSVGYLSDAYKSACQSLGEKSCQVITYRYRKNDNATVYSPNMALNEAPPLVSLPFQSYWNRFQSGLYYLYLP
ncbi:signal peptide peptidase SppA [Thiomicrorhabdus heinhorstiae]|uniref:Signal peptide peptidase SppA n=1 Tax=Thiomicrorhabdus heinhorstiae TaxID=2748010 RepID=A0ABS0C0N8_9GAMM|nr:signal peptide peptidase SppA [Thiomicrorhabdus heinhorstiae]MBF6058850.1 signal peptide peptidase SppA [Thiomicrorhabdus heinhorstiae]